MFQKPHRRKYKTFENFLCGCLESKREIGIRKSSVSSFSLPLCTLKNRKQSCPFGKRKEKKIVESEKKFCL